MSSFTLAWDVISFWAWVQFFTYIWWKIGHQMRTWRQETNWITAWVAFPIWFSYITWSAVHGSSFEKGWYALMQPINVLLWWFLIVNDSDKDDRWRKRRKKALAKVKQIAGKLVVVPIPQTEPV